MPNIDLLLIPLISGFFFVKKSNITRFQVARDNAQSTLLKSGFFGFIFYAIAYLGWYIIHAVWTPTDFLVFIYPILQNEYYAAPSILTFFLSLIAVYSINNLEVGNEEKHKLNVIINDDDAFETHLLDSQFLDKDLMITLKNNKIYIGQVTDTFFRVNDEIQSFRILPIASGYRTSITKDVHIDTVYPSTSDVFEINKARIRKYIYDRGLDLKTEYKNGNFRFLTLKDFEITLIYSEVVSVSYWDVDVFDYFDVTNQSDNKDLSSERTAEKE